MESHWKLFRYARHRRHEELLEGEWEHFTSSDSNQLELCIQHGSILLSYGKSVMESYVLSLGKTCLRAVCKGDSMLVIYKMKDKSHKFRMKFDKSDEKSEEENCRGCAEVMSNSFPVKIIPIKPLHETKPTESTSKKAKSTVLQGEVTLSQIAEVVAKRSTDISLPECYRNISDFQDDEMRTCLKLCLADPSFPEFVGQVEKELDKLKQEFSAAL